MARSDHHTFAGDFRRFFLRGLAILLPTLVTVGILLWAWGFLSKNIAEPINKGVRVTVLTVAPLVVGEENMPSWYQVSDEELAEARASSVATVSDDALRTRIRRAELKEYWSTHFFGVLNLIGFVIAIVLVYLIGVMVGNLLGRRLYARVESLLVRVPIIKQVYPNVKQVTDFLVGGGQEKKKTFATGRVVLVEYPRKGIWTVGLMTGETLSAIEHIAGERCVTVFIPSSPTPFTGYTITVPAREVHALPISMDETIRFVVSGGVLVPEGQRPKDVPQINEGEMTGLPGDGGGGDLAGGGDAPMMEGGEGAAEGGGRTSA